MIKREDTVTGTTSKPEEIEVGIDHDDLGETKDINYMFDVSSEDIDK